MDKVEHWFKYEPPKGKSGKQKNRDKYREQSVSCSPSGGSKSRSKSNQNSKQRIINTLNKSPEVMVKITGSSNGSSKAMAHLKYIARQGKLEIEDESKITYSGKESLEDIRSMMKAAQVPSEAKGREYIHVLFSMPPKTPKDELKEAVKSVCEDEFSNRHYYMALHDDTDHTHVHVLVSMRDKDRAGEAKLNPRKPDLRRWRMKFAEELNDRGIDASATSRNVRMQFEKGDHSAVANMGKFDPESKHYNPSEVAKLAEKRYKRAIENQEKAFVGAYRPHKKSFIESIRRVNPELPVEYKKSVASALDRAKQGWEDVARIYPELKTDIDRFVASREEKINLDIDSKQRNTNEDEQTL